MMDFKYVYLIGIGGIGMSALARYFNNKGLQVSGYDRTPSSLTRKLEAEGIRIHYESDISKIPENISETLVIYTPAIPENFEEMSYIKGQGYRYCKRSRALGELARGQECLAVSGTHGKTTTSTLLAHILTQSGEGCNAFLGGISKNYESNLLLSKSPVLVAEADEFDRSFLQLFPKLALITATDADHLDIYDNHQKVIEAFCAFASQVDSAGALVIKQGVEINLAKVDAKAYRYSYNTPCDFYASDITPVEGGRFEFTINHPAGRIEHCTVGIPGWVNVENAVGASALALLHGVAPVRIREALATFKGVRRRFDIRVNEEGIAYVDDYAHHPAELAASISSIRNIFPDKKICGIFQPHLYTRTRDFADGFAESLSNLDILGLLPIYPAREEPIEGVSSEMIYSKVTIREKHLIEKEEITDFVRKHRDCCIVTLGAGDIDRFVEPIEECLREQS